MCDTQVTIYEPYFIESWDSAAKDEHKMRMQPTLSESIFC